MSGVMAIMGRGTYCAGAGVMPLQDLPTLAEVEASRPRACPKAGLPAPLARKARKKTKERLAKDFRDAIWLRDKGKSRATGRKVHKSGTTDWSKLGEVDHSVPRSLAPERIYDVCNGILLSKEENRLRKVSCVRAPEFRMFDYTGPDDRALPQTFVWRDADGKETKLRIG